MIESASSNRLHETAEPYVKLSKGQYIVANTLLANRNTKRNGLLSIIGVTYKSLATIGFGQTTFNTLNTLTASHSRAFISFVIRKNLINLCGILHFDVSNNGQCEMKFD